MSAPTQDEPPADQPPPDDEKRDAGDVVQKVARVSEPVLSATSAGLSIGTVAAAVAGDIPLVGPLLAVGITALLPVAVAAVQRRREAHSDRAVRAHSYADEAWNAIVASREG
jgi:hypothetical protein